MLPDRVQVVRLGPGSEGVTAYLRDVLGGPVLVSLYIGPPRAVQKPILQLLTPHGRTFAFAKIGVTDQTRALVQAESQVLRVVASAPLSTLDCPEVLHRGQWDGNDVLVLGAVPVPRRGGHIDASRLTRAALEVAALRGRYDARLAESRYWAGLRARVRTLSGSPLSALLRRALDRLAPVAASAVLEFGSWHGDWAPWNMALSAGRVAVWDWEKFEPDVPWGFDVVHYDVQSAVVLRDVEPVEAFRSAIASPPAGLRCFGLDEPAARLVVLLYAVEIACRYLADGEVELDATRMGRLNEWLEPVLREHLSGLASAALR